MASNPGISLQIDATEMMHDLDHFRSQMSQDQFERAMASVFRRVPGHVRKILKQDIPKKYQPKKSDIGAAIRGAQISSGFGGNLGCVIPVVGKRLGIGTGFKATGGASGWNNVRTSKGRKRIKKYKIRAKIVTSGISTLPDQMSSYGGQPPFRNLSAKKPGFKKNTWTRAGKARYPLMRVVGIAVPQMPLNRSKPDVQNDIATYMQERVRHECEHRIAAACNKG